MRKLLVILLLLLITPFIRLSAQELKGNVLNENGRKAAGILVQFKNSGKKVLTKSDGSFKIKAEKLPDTLILSAIGFEPYKILITEKSLTDPDFQVVMLNARKTLNEVVVRGLASSSSSKTLGLATMRNDSYKRTDSVSAGSSLLGMVPGVKVDGGSAKGFIETRPALMYEYLESPASMHSIEGRKIYFNDTNIAPREGQLAKSRIVTAGEVNDFNKWKMWEDYSENEFKSAAGIWKMNTANRYSLQLTNKNHDAITNEPVFLVNKLNGDTMWRAYTDNTGKAELWAMFTGGMADKTSYYITDRYGHSIQSPVDFANGMNVLVVDRACAVSNDVDIAFVVDATGSMGDEIEFLKLELEDVIQHTIDKYSSLNLRASSVFYRDKGDAYLSKLSGLSDNMLKTMNFIKLQRAEGGGDYAEAVDDAMQTALDSLQWNKQVRAKILFLVLDAPPHADAVERMQRLTMKAAAMGIRIVPVACSGTDKSTEFLLRSMALATNGTYTFLTNHSGVGASHIEPTTDKYEVELLNSLLQRIIGQFLTTRDCNAGQQQMVQETVKQPDNILSLKIYPNPTTGRFVAEASAELKEIFITDFTGKILQRIAAGSSKQLRWNVDIGNYPSGAYLVKYITPDNKWGAEKVILAR